MPKKYKLCVWFQDVEETLPSWSETGAVWRLPAACGEESRDSPQPWGFRGEQFFSFLIPSNEENSWFVTARLYL